MKFISYLGNLFSIDKTKENTLDYINDALDQGFYVLINLESGGENLTKLKNSEKVLKLSDLNSDYIFFPEFNEIKYSTLLNKFDECSKGIVSNYIGFYRQRLIAKETYAMLITGRIATYENNLLPQLIQFYKKNPSIYFDIYSSVNHNLDQYHEDFKKLNLKYYNLEIFKCDQRYLYHQHVRPEYVSKHQNIYNFISYFYNLKKCLIEIKKSGINYSKILHYRTDVIADNLIELDSVQENTLYFPKINIYKKGWINSQVYYGTLNTMLKFIDLYDNLDRYIYDYEILLHPEILMTVHMKFNMIDFNMIDFNYELDSKRHSCIEFAGYLNTL